MDIILILKIVIVIVLLVIGFLTLRSIFANRKVRRIGYYALEPLKDNSLSFSDKITDKYLSFVKGMRRYVSKRRICKK